MRAHHLLLTLGLSGTLFGIALGYVCCSQPNTSRCYENYSCSEGTTTSYCCCHNNCSKMDECCCDLMNGCKAPQASLQSFATMRLPADAVSVRFGVFESLNATYDDAKDSSELEEAA
ncbi:hypothetical protein BDZ90DRAFT_95806 [Jaminaea rosea]|uniref:SMB domain-containing protein n=1 Tax=Jaminaea rosea TaxID=1569628 RepID=A0A316UIS1_9BASI|nr:hypothetical protein BDZ90DRAFT_95806 [Jaminaea rosea]PWN24768.1 hypothetical protein BDZ90DRAFT_95806 [Jaminaea rosea]